MGKYIDKDALAAEIKRLENDEFLCDSYDMATGFQSALQMVQEFISTLDVKEVDLEKEINRFTMSKELYEADSVIKAVAEHFFELGLKTQKEG